MKLFYKLFGFLIVGITLLLVLDGYLSIEREVVQFDRAMTENALQIGSIMSGLIEHAWMESGENKAIELINDANLSNHSVTLRWVWLENPLDPLHLPWIDAVKFAQLKQGDTFSLKTDKRDETGFRYTYIPLKLENHTISALEIQQSLLPLSEYSHKMLIQSLKGGVLLLLTSFLFLYCFIDRQVRRRLEPLSDKAKQIGKGDYEPNLTVRGNDELSDQAAIMNVMCSRLQAAQAKIDTVHEARIKTLEQLRHTERLSTLGHISAGIAHEMGTPLNIVSGRAKMIEAGTLPLQDMINSARIIKNQSDRMTRIIRQFLDFTRRRKPQYTPTNVLSLIRQVFEILTPIAKKKGVTLELTHADEIETRLRMDANQIQQVLINLIMNSIQAMPHGGRGRVNVFKKKCDHTTPPGNEQFLGIACSDDGEGIDKEILEHVFEPFFTTKTAGEGTGLGLSIVQGIIEEHQGWIEVKSDTAKGTTFVIYLPMGQEK
jgi:signal transduction histidine kinase